MNIIPPHFTNRETEHEVDQVAQWISHSCKVRKLKLIPGASDPVRKGPFKRNVF